MNELYKKKLIEVAIPLEAINAAAVREKSIRHGHPSTLHLWWARRPLAACRAVLFAQLVDDPSSHPDKFPTLEKQETERERLFKIIENLVIWENSTNEEVLELAKAEIRKSCGDVMPTIYDPFSGGGSIPLEAQRLGLSAFGSDLNPVAVMIGKSMIQFPPLFRDLEPIHPGLKDRNFYRNAEGLAEDVKYYGERMWKKANELVGDLYPEIKLPVNHGDKSATVIAWIWSRTVKCMNPGCNFDVPTVSSFALSTKRGREAYLHPKLCDEGIEFDVKKNPMGTVSDAKKGFKRGKSGIFECPACGVSTTRDYVAQEGVKGRIGAHPIAIVAEGARGRIFLPFPKEHVPASLKVDTAGLETKLQPNPRDVWCRNFGLTTPADLFTQRQIMTLTTFCELVQEARTTAESDAIAAGLSHSSSPLRESGLGAKAYSEAICVYLALLVDQLANNNSTLCTWHSRNTQLRSVFARQALPMTWDFAESNPFCSSSGSFINLHERMVKGFQTLAITNTPGYLEQKAAQEINYNDAVISSDPPYYDNIGYADLSDFFYVWLRKSLKGIFPDLFSTLVVPRAEELVATSYRHTSKGEAEDFFLEGMTNAIRRMAERSHPNFPTTIYYAFKQSEIDTEGVSSTGWATFLTAIIAAGFSIVGTWPVRTELATRMIAKDTNALSSSVVIVCRKMEKNTQTAGRADFIRNLKTELPNAISALQRANIEPADMPQSSIGPGMGIFTRYSTVLEADDSPMTVKTALQLINSELDEFLSNIQGDFDSDTRFSITWFEQNGYANGDFGVANSIAQARSIAVDSVKHAGIVESSAGNVRILKRDELLEDWDPLTDSHLTIWECLQYLVREHEENGISYEAAVLLKKMEDKADAIKDLAYCLYDICANKRQDAKEATAYNALIADWTELTRQAATIHDVSGERQSALDL
jgi:putative DNA methylase